MDPCKEVPSAAGLDIKRKTSILIAGAGNFLWYPTSSKVIIGLDFMCLDVLSHIIMRYQYPSKVKGYERKYLFISGEI